MRLLQYSNNGEFRLTQFFGDVPRYAILSHTWGPEEVTFRDMMEGNGTSKTGFDKIRFCGEQASRDDLQYFWVDTCCIDKSSSAELSEAINSMYAWYQKASVCYAYLSDISPELMYEARWFRRGWTLQELIAPSHVKFFSKDGDFIGTKSDRKTELSAITGIDEAVLAGKDLFQVPVAERMSWASKRTTTRVEDIAYCLLGLFDVNMPLLYGEGIKAFQRLQKKIVKQSNDHSLFAWSDNPRSDDPRSDDIQPGQIRLAGPLATSPSQFVNAGDVTSYAAENEEPYSMTNKGLRIWLRMKKALPNDDTLYIAALSCYRIGTFIGPVVLVLEHLQGNEFARWDRTPRETDDLQAPLTWDNKVVFIKESNFNRSRFHMLRSIQIQLALEESTSTTDERGARRGFRLAVVVPPRLWDGSKVTLSEDLELEQTVAFIFERNGKVFIVHICLCYARDHVKWEVRIEVLPGYDIPNAHMPSTIQDSICGTFQITPLLDPDERKLTLSTTSDAVLSSRIYDGATYTPSEEVRISFRPVVGSNLINFKVDVIEG